MRLQTASAHQRLAQKFSQAGPLLHIVLDGWGIGSGDEGDAIAKAHTPTLDAFTRQHPHTTLYTHGHHVGLPAAKDIGGSEVGHMTMGAGRILQQGSTRIHTLLQKGLFFQSQVAQQMFARCQEGAPLHLIGLVSDGNVHSHIQHFYAVIHEAVQREVQRLYVHALLDGRDVGYQSAEDYIHPLEAHLQGICQQHPGWLYAIASGGGRETITMDRDQNWNKIALGWQTHVQGKGWRRFSSASKALKAFRQQMPQASDQDMPPFVVQHANGHPVGAIEDGAVVVCMNFRSDRVIELSQAMTQTHFTQFERGPLPKMFYVGMTTYDEDTNLPKHVLTPAIRVKRPLGERILEHGLGQFRLAETQKYAHVTFFFNGGQRTPLDAQKEVHHLIPSDKIDSYAQAPKMQALQIAQKTTQLLVQSDARFGLINFANADMVGHTGNLQAVIQAVQAVDKALAHILPVLQQVGGVMLITADHGNAEEMVVHNSKTQRREPSTKHSVNPVPLYVVDPLGRLKGVRLRPLQQQNPNTLANLAATDLVLLGLPLDDDMAEPLFEGDSIA